MNILYYDCFSGVSGDMNLGAMVDIGVDPVYLKAELAKLNLEGYSIDFITDIRKGISGTRAIVHINKGFQSSGHTHPVFNKPEDEIHEDSAHGHDTHEHDTYEHDAHGYDTHEHGTHEPDTHGHDIHGYDNRERYTHNHDANEKEAHRSDSQVQKDFEPTVTAHGHRNLNDIRNIINNSSLNDFVKTTSLDIFRKVAEAEAKVHAKSIDEIYFHEVGAIDSIVDIVGAAICFDYLKPDKVISSSIELGGGFTRCEHGIFPVPAPATAEILKNIPVKSGAVRSEATTPTGAAILATLVNEFTDNIHFTIQKTGYGIGTKDFEIPNVLRVHIGELAGQPSSGEEIHTAYLVECNIDDMNPEMYGYIMDLLFEKGADDVFITPIIMKKARPASKLSVLCRPEIDEEITDILLTHTTSLGVRKQKVEKIVLKRQFQEIMTRYGPVTLKTAIYKGKRLKSKPEYEDCIRIAKEKNIPVHLVYQEINRVIASLNSDAK